MYYYLYKKEINILIGIIVGILIISGIYFFLPQNPIRNLEIDKQGDIIKYDEKDITTSKYDYYQVYIYPEEFVINCESKEKGVCDNVDKNKEMIKKYNIGFFGKDLTTGDKSKQELKTFLSDKQNNKTFLKDIFTQLYVGEIKPNKNTGYEKYFEYKKEDGQEIILNDMELMCVNQIKQTIPVGSFDEENIIKQKVKEQCSPFANINPLQIAFGGFKNGEKKEVKLKLDIQKVKLEYKFFKKENKEFKEKIKENKIINMSYILEDFIDLTNI